MSSLFHSSSVKGPQQFEVAWSIYPDRHVSENKRDALRQWLHRIREGVDPEEMLEGCKRYRAYADRLRLTGTEYVMQPRRFFGASRHFEQDWIIRSGQIQARAELSSRTTEKLKSYERDRLPPEQAGSILADIRKGLK